MDDNVSPLWSRLTYYQQLIYREITKKYCVLIHPNKWFRLYKKHYHISLTVCSIKSLYIIQCVSKALNPSPSFQIDRVQSISWKDHRAPHWGHLTKGMLRWFASSSSHSHLINYRDAFQDGCHLILSALQSASGHNWYCSTEWLLKVNKSSSDVEHNSWHHENKANYGLILSSWVFLW